ncbi:aldehyde dehydrogenase family protein [Achromobacter insolitus]|uniref:aldehyde dehydrogenase family protein n=1 Tax=Achromobacter insolitus TaxID=217204 RepID=UPI0009728C1D|nr:aldehyde dehydrogenase family protein [Achromobacter insolitus]GLK96676.1 putative aldehyde dehydrogenase DhaS [Achromobacter xylosoxidans]APX75222.1 betaine-aldehyde dehydrogenase [Achromobacter insolitus]AVG40158.1 betaine-aldehyde dehydrogenase [Achromobacter insolitus]MCP1402494.1 betaine-aldehyde dehydrogenase [Achromobacter insolitus]NGT16219.1 aldehyde dehydrogenase family protein [Achromobacter insolitus]
MQNKLFIDGRFVDAAAGGTIDVLNPHDGSLITAIAAAEAEDVDRAVQAAQRAFPAWARMAAADRGRLLLKLADLIEANAEELAQLETLDTGHPIRDTRGLDVPRTAGCFRYFGGMADKLQGSVIPVESGFLNYVQRAPIGVVGQIVPWNFPLMFTSWKLGPALAAGNTVVLKPSELTPLSTLRIAELMAAAGFPDGVVNVVPGYGHTAGQRLAEHPDVGKIAFTGSTATGRRIVEASKGNLKRVQLELGGKGANIVFDDANLDAAINGAAWAIFHNQGQACIAGSRLMLHEKIADAFLERFTALANSIRLGDPRSPDTEMGPLTSAQHRDKVLSYVGIAAEQGARLLAGGKAPGGELSAGYYVAPTIVEARPQDRVAQEEVFGPFVTVLRFGSDEEALAIANATDYGLGSGLWTRDLARAHKLAGAIHAGMCWINCYKRVNPGSPFGGVGQSGYGREMGFEAMHDYTEARSVWVNVDAAVPPHFKR